MMRVAAVTLVLCSIPSWADPGDLQGRMKEGLCEITTAVEASGMEGAPGGLKMPGMTTQRCISGKQVDDASQSNFVQPGPMAQLPRECALQDFTMSADTATYKMACAGQSRMAMDGAIAFTGSGYHGANHDDHGPGQDANAHEIEF